MPWRKGSKPAVICRNAYLALGILTGIILVTKWSADVLYILSVSAVHFDVNVGRTIGEVLGEFCPLIHVLFKVLQRTA